MKAGHAVGIKLHPHLALFSAEVPNIRHARDPQQGGNDNVLPDLVHIILIEVWHFRIGFVEDDPHDRI